MPNFVRVGRNIVSLDAVSDVMSEEDGRLIVRMVGGSVQTLRGEQAAAFLAALEARDLMPAAPAPAAPSTPAAAPGGAK